MTDDSFKHPFYLLPLNFSTLISNNFHRKHSIVKVQITTAKQVFKEVSVARLLDMVYSLGVGSKLEKDLCAATESLLNDAVGYDKENQIDQFSVCYTTVKVSVSLCNRSPWPRFSE